MAAGIRIREGTADDSRQLAELMNAAGEGIPAYLWSQMAAPGVDPLDFGTRRVQQCEGGFSYTNTHVAVVDGAFAGMLLSYRLPDPYDLAAFDDVPEIVRPALELESLVPGFWYINAVATAEAFRGRGVATALLELAPRLARDAGAQTTSLIVAEENGRARRLYEKLGYATFARRLLVPFPGCPHGGDWLLMTRAAAH